MATKWTAARDRGTSLTELLVTMALFSIVMVAILTISIGFTRTNAQTITRQDQVDTARVASETLSKTLRTAVMPSQLITNCGGDVCHDVAFLLGQDYAVRFFANLDNGANSVGPSKVTYTLATSGPTAGTLTETIQVPDDSNVANTGGYYQYCDAEAVGASSTCKARLHTRTVATGVQFTTGTPLLTYYDNAGNLLSPATNGGSLTAADLSQVVSVELTVTVQQAGSSQVRPTTYIQRVTLPNAQSALRQNQEQTP